MQQFHRLFLVIAILPYVSFPASAQQNDVYYAEIDAGKGDTILSQQEEDQASELKSTVFDVFGKWVDEQVDSAKTFLDDHVYNQFDNKDDSLDADPFDEIFHSNTQTYDGGSFRSMAQSVIDMTTGDPSVSSVDRILTTARQWTGNNKRQRSFQQTWDLFTTNIQSVMSQVKETFKHISFDHFNPISMYYFTEFEDERKTPSWKRRQHRFQKALEPKTLRELHDALYLSHLAYANTWKDIQQGMQQFANHSYELIYATTKGLPGEPAHFMAVKKQSTQQKPLWLWPPRKPQELEILFVVRGTKELGDAISDGLLMPQDYRNGKVHGGIEKAGKFLVNHQIETLKHLLNASQQKTIRMTMVGHSLGAGAAAIAAMEFNDYKWISATSIGFGCPALLNLELGGLTKDYITTVVSDADVVPRLSGASLANMLLDIMSYDWTAKGLEDIDLFLHYLNGTVPIEIPKAMIMDWVKAGMEKNDKPYFNKVPTDRLPTILYPPGTCIHLFRDGSGYTGTYTPCESFHRIEFTRTLVDDHLIPIGYHKAMVGMLRDFTGNLNDNFEHDLMGLPIK